jgi:hypothetical protein
MGMDQKVIFPPEKTPSWPALVESFAQKGLPLQMRMIDGELAFPDEAPPENWREVRVAVGGGMITLRRESDGITLVIWGNADIGTREAWHAMAQALATLTGGSVR